MSDQNKNKQIVLLRTCDAQMQGSNKRLLNGEQVSAEPFVWKVDEINVAEDYTPEPCCGGGLHGLVNGIGETQFSAGTDALRGFRHNLFSPNKKLKNKLGWVIIGGESGNDSGYYRYRKCDLDWIEDLVLQCQRAYVPAFVKQLGTYLSKQLNLSQDRHGANIDNFPAYLRVREFPNFKCWE